MMHVSVVMPVYNERRTVEAAIASIQAQTFRNWDMLIVDDGSTDGSTDLIRSAAGGDPRIRLIASPCNRGVPASLNAGWRQARGELIARMDADDISLPQRLARQVAFLQAHPNVDVLGTAAEVVDSQGRPMGQITRPEEHEILARKVYKEVPFIHPTVIARRHFYEAMNGYDERWSHCQDADLWLRSYRRFRFHNLPNVLLRYSAPGDLTFRQAAEKAAMLINAAHRDGRLLTHGWYALRWLAVGVLMQFGLYRFPTQAAQAGG